MTIELKDYEVTFKRDPLLGLWSWTIATPDGRKLGPLWGTVCTDKTAAEKQALRRIEFDMCSESLTGEELAERVEARQSASDA